jgi:GxxExxY protein
MKNKFNEKILKEMCNRIYDDLGPYYIETTYQSAMEHELNKQGIRYRREMQIPIYYDNIIIAHGTVDFWIAPNYLVEFKAKKKVSLADKNQVKRYLKSLKIPFGYLINFNPEGKKLDITPIVNEHFKGKELEV